MCNRESFVLFPQETGIPVAWSVSYHHEDILRGVILRGVPRLYGRGLRELVVIDDYVQIECTGGDAYKWDWDNTPMKEIRHIEYPPPYSFVSCKENMPVEPIEVRYSSIKEPIIPHWLEDNLRFYENRIEKILEDLNPVRDRAERLQEDLIKIFFNQNAWRFTKPGIPEMLESYPSDSPEVKEFEWIINAYLGIPGFVEQPPTIPNILVV